jgi:hypothetical protein
MANTTRTIPSRNSTMMAITVSCQKCELMKMRFTLIPGRWYAMEMVSDAFGSALRDHSPIRVNAIRPTHTGQRVFELQFYHANAPEGVRTKRYTLLVLERGERFLFAKSTHHTPPRLLLVYEITAEWLWQHVHVKLPAECEVDEWLNRYA